MDLRLAKRPNRSEGSVKQITRICQILFGEMSLRIVLPFSLVKSDRTSAPADISLSGYGIKVNGTEVRIFHRSVWRDLTGWPALYQFVGQATVSESSESKQCEYAGSICMRPFPKIFFGLWFGLVLTGLVVMAMREVSLLLQDSHNSASLTELGAALIISAFVLASGALLLWILRLIARGERQRLIEFCKGLNVQPH